MSLLFNILSRFVIAFLPRSKCLLISWLQSPSAVILEPKKRKSVTISTFSPFICHRVMGLDAVILVFWMLSFKPGFSLSSFTLIKKLFNSSPLFPIKVVSSAYLRLLIFLLAIWIPACDSFSLAFCMTYSAYKLNKQGDNIQPSCTPFPVLNQSIVPCPVLTVASLTWMLISQEAGKVVWYSHLFKNFPQLVVIHTVKGFSIVSEAEVDVFLEFPCFLYDPVDVDSRPFLNQVCTSRSSWFTCCWSLAWRIFNITLLACEVSVIVQYFEHSLALPFFRLEWKLTFSNPMATAEFSRFAGIFTSTRFVHNNAF